MKILDRLILGNYINFAILEYYNDSSFSQVCEMTLQLILSHDLKQVKNHKKIISLQYKLILVIFEKQMEMVFIKFDFQFIVKVVDWLVQGVQLQDYEVKCNSMISLNHLNTFLWKNLNKPSKKQPQLAQNVNDFFSKHSGIF